MKRAHMKSLPALLLACFTASAFAQTAEKPAGAANPSAPTNAAATNNLGRDIGYALEACRENESFRYSRGSVVYIDDFNPTGPDFFNRIMDGKKSSLRTDRGYPESFSSTALVVIDPTNKLPIKRGNLDGCISALCSLAVGNEANIVILNMTDLKDDEKKLMRKTILDKIGAKVTGQMGKDGKKLDLATLLSEKQVNIIGLIAEDSTKPQELTPFHSADSHYEDKVGGLADKASATYWSWKKEAVARERREYPETVSWLITNREPNFEGRMASLIDGRGVPPDVNSEKLPHALLLIVDPDKGIYGHIFLITE